MSSGRGSSRCCRRSRAPWGDRRAIIGRWSRARSTGTGPGSPGGTFRRISDRGEVALEADSHTGGARSEEHTSELQSLTNLVCRLLLEKKKKNLKILRTRIKKKNKKRTK